MWLPRMIPIIKLAGFRLGRRAGRRPRFALARVVSGRGRAQRCHARIHHGEPQRRETPEGFAVARTGGGESGREKLSFLRYKSAMELGAALSNAP